jgi:hypothetical protein
MIKSLSVVCPESTHAVHGFPLFCEYLRADDSSDPGEKLLGHSGDRVLGRVLSVQLWSTRGNIET